MCRKLIRCGVAFWIQIFLKSKKHHVSRLFESGFGGVRVSTLACKGLSAVCLLNKGVFQMWRHFRAEIRFGASPHAGMQGSGAFSCARFMKAGSMALLLQLYLGSASAQASDAMVTAAASPNTAAPAREWVTPQPGDAQRGLAFYQSNCTACHAVDANKIGPAHRGVLGRRVGSLPGYTYSEELARSRLRWTPQTLNAWLEDPEGLVPGQRMGFQVGEAQQRADLIAYLSSLK